jgi:hypothetical protein
LGSAPEVPAVRELIAADITYTNGRLIHAAD